ncbi:MAG: macro domain-containing protein [Saprospirales bacterium]|nr:MAG: macro domain-containing protein [Saprospirales bacterium]
MIDKNKLHEQITFTQGDITKQADIEAIVNAANSQLRTGGGVAGAIHKAAGPQLERECLPLAPIEPGEAVITGAYNLPNQNVIHSLGPVYGKDKPEAEILTDCYRNALILADENGLKSIAFPAISTGIFGYPIEEATPIALKTTAELLTSLKNIEEVRFVLFSKSDLNIYREIWSEMTIK